MKFNLTSLNSEIGRWPIPLNWVNISWLLTVVQQNCHPTFSMAYIAFLSEDKCCFEMENLVTTYKLPKGHFSEVLCIIKFDLQPFQILKWRKVYDWLYLKAIYVIGSPLKFKYK